MIFYETLVDIFQKDEVFKRLLQDYKGGELPEEEVLKGMADRLYDRYFAGDGK